MAKLTIITAAQMRQLEDAAMATGAVTGLALMERAGAGVVEAILEHWPELTDGSHSAVVLCGPGNNGGDGFVIARLLRSAGWSVETFFYGTVAGLPPDARTNYDRWASTNPVRMLSFPDVTEEDGEVYAAAAYQLSGTDVVVDALFGIGLSRPIIALEPIIAYNDLYAAVAPSLMPARHVSVDLPSGIKTDAPEPYDRYCKWFLADLTVTFHALKPAHVHPNSAPSCGYVVIKDIGL